MNRVQAVALLKKKRKAGRPSKEMSLKLAKARMLVKKEKVAKNKNKKSVGRLRSTKTVLKKYPSKSKKGVFYEIRVGKDGRVYCTCPVWKFKKEGRRTCKHLRDFSYVVRSYRKK